MKLALLRCSAAAAIMMAGGIGWAQSNDIKVSIANIPGMADSPEKGVFVEFMKALDEEYTEGRILIEVVPFGRAHRNVATGDADLALPGFILPGTPDAKFPYSWIPEPMGAFTMVIYSPASKPLGKKDVDEAMARGGKFPFVVEAGGGSEAVFPFPIQANNDLPGALKKVQAKRSDAVLWASEGDLVLRELRLKGVHREAFDQYHDVVLVSKTPRGELVKAKIDAAMKRMRASGKLQKVYAKVHPAWEEWQPADMGW